MCVVIDLNWSFEILQLETDPDILLQKADAAMNKYQMNVVVANLLATFKQEVIAVTKSERATIRQHGPDADVEEQIIRLLVEKHAEYVEQSERAPQ